MMEDLWEAQDLRSYADILDASPRTAHRAVTVEPGEGIVSATLEMVGVTDWLARDLARLCREVAEDLKE